MGGGDLPVTIPLTLGLAAAVCVGADGSLTLYVQTKPPGQDERSNWLPAPEGDFSLYIRAYWPEAAITDGTWTPPAVERTQ